jgi:ActR/RegA family two-component response regulator
VTTTARGGTPLRLQVLAIIDDSATIDMMSRALGPTGDVLSVATDLAEGLARAGAEAPDLVVVDVSMGQSAGLAVVHHLRAVAPNVAVYALTGTDALALGTQAVALGGTGLLMKPLSGDELLTAASEVRTRLAEREQRLLLERAAERSRHDVELLGQAAELCQAENRREVAERLSALLESRLGATDVLVYVPAGEGSRQLMQVARRGTASGAPAFCDDMELMAYAAARDLELIRLTLNHESLGLMLLGGLRAPEPARAPALLDLVATQAATAFALMGEREQSRRGSMKDPSSSAYTFAYFVDVAGREIDKARRYGRRFALATLGVGTEAAAFPSDDEPVTVRFDSKRYAHASESGAPPSAPLPPSSTRELSVEAVERVLDAVRDTDVLARVDESEFYLLLPETGGTGAHTCRRRVMRKLSGGVGQRRTHSPELDVSMGVATFPHDGTDLSQLLRVAKHRADASRRSVVRRLELERLGLAEILDALFWSLADPTHHDAGLEAPRVIELPAVDLIGLAVSAVREAIRGGAAQIVATQRAGVSIGASVRAALGRERGDLTFHALDVSALPGYADIEALTIVAEHAAYALLGRVDRGVVRAVHTADPLFVDLVTQRLGDAVGMRLLD